MDKMETMACAIMDLFDDFLTDRNITVPCSDRHEQAQRMDSGAAIYGSEYFNLAEAIEVLLEGGIS